MAGLSRRQHGMTDTFDGAAHQAQTRATACCLTAVSTGSDHVTAHCLTSCAAGGPTPPDRTLGSFGWYGAGCGIG